ncbi:M67 family metallopeptidase [bacterium]|nr:M67 family metallopeptidase [bacterium]
MQVLWLTHAQVQAIGDHARAAAPDEACGLIAGRGSRAVRVLPLDNIAQNRQQTYLIDAAQLAASIHQFEREGLSLIGIYHSHPAGDPIPSPADMCELHYPHTAYLIVGLRHNHANFAAWLLHNQRQSGLICTSGTSHHRPLIRSCHHHSKSLLS